jgi:hypothetical protein
MDKEVWLVCRNKRWGSDIISEFDNEHQAKISWDFLVKAYKYDINNDLPKFIAKCELIERYEY